MSMNVLPFAKDFGGVAKRTHRSKGEYQQRPRMLHLSHFPGSCVTSHAGKDEIASSWR